MHRYRIIAITLGFICNNVALAVTPVEYRVTLTNNNWFPLERHEMKAAASSAALDELTSHGDLKLLESDTEGNQQIGTLKIDLILVERAQTVQIQLSLDLPGHQSTYITQTSADLSQLSYQGIRRQFETIGQNSAQKLLERMQQTAGREAKVQRSLDETISTLQRTAKELETKTGTPEEVDRYSSTQAKALYEKAQSLKRQHQFKEAQKLFTQLTQQTGLGTENWRELAQDELNYGLPTMQTQLWFQQWSDPSLSPRKRKELQVKMEKKLKHISDANPDKPDRVLEAQRQQDQLQYIGGYMNRILQSNEKVKLRSSLTQQVIARNGDQTRDAIEKQLKSSNQTNEYEISSYKKTGEHQAEVQLKNSKYGIEFTVTFDGYDVSIEPL
ncbi:hypothetical protein GP5015_861 [gamma proteobacterium HTCC5015]|nr:hypothetical protein GP5015_861 [gamma proteobacterium HTCC5015]